MDYIKYAYIALIGWGCWAVGSKLISQHLNAVNTSFWISFWSFFFLIFYILFFKKTFQFNHYALWSIPVGFFSLIAILAFYRALKTGPASVVIPLTNLYVLFPVIFGFLVLKEPVTLNRILGIAFAIIATLLLSR
ncbi:MAG: EamA family transporter [candidate division WOR-3 bacterium]|nr:EamA family transporter [candidate division WOR-3 bacterium]